MALFHAKFACNLAISNPVFRWESCKGNEWENVKKCSKLCSEAETRGWISWVARSLQAAKRCIRVKHVEKLNHHASCRAIGKKVQSGHLVIWQLGLVTQSSREAKLPVHFVIEKLTFRIPFSLQYKYPLYPRNIESFQKEFWKRNPKEKKRLTYPQSLHNDSSNSSTLTLSIVTSLRGLLAKNFLIIPISVRRLFGAWEVVRKGPIDIGWSYGL